ncbi:hypothetical protein [Catellatospora sp. NPDC049133]|uniref:hypothetical protein n=1 Tax=Catellatospora sp. NPDC049133 TaxID=3155499 RepID=UPI0033C1A410
MPIIAIGAATSTPRTPRIVATWSREIPPKWSDRKLGRISPAAFSCSSREPFGRTRMSYAPRYFPDLLRDLQPGSVDGSGEDGETGGRHQHSGQQRDRAGSAAAQLRQDDPQHGGFLTHAL